MVKLLQIKTKCYRFSIESHKMRQVNIAISLSCKSNNKTAINYATKKFVRNVIYNFRKINHNFFFFKTTFKY